jgi:DNA-binding MarR family transcriptional regulator
VRIVSPTPKTRAAVAEAKGIADGIYDEALAGLPPGTRETLTDTLRQIIQNLSNTPETNHDR